MELTNNCNLACPNCPNPTLKRKKGYMTKETFKTSIKYIPPAGRMSFHGLGEPLLHSNLIEWLSYALDYKLDAVLSTNGVLMTKGMAKAILNIMREMRNPIFYISFHTQKSVDVWRECMEIIDDYPNVFFKGQILEHNTDQSVKWLKQVGIYDIDNYPHLRRITSHSFAGNVSSRQKVYGEIEVRNRIRACGFLRNNLAQVRWDGRLSTCCFDAECTTGCGSIFDFENARNNLSGTPICYNCDPDFATGYH